MENNIKMTKKQESLFNYLNSGKKLIQERNALFMENGETVNTKTLISLMYKLNPKNYREDLRNSIIIK
jgi:hypothetical protein